MPLDNFAQMPPIPDCIIDRIDELNRLCDENPLTLSVPQVAKFLHINADGLRYSIERGQCPFGLCWQKGKNAYRAFTIPTVTFYLCMRPLFAMRTPPGTEIEPKVSA